ncbi:endolytic transglycosylase MltG [Patescibacteria group bacterium]|nr:MAG: endolytic transglycosylase MltG [Patescibacteria group bacterium]
MKKILLVVIIIGVAVFFLIKKSARPKPAPIIPREEINITIIPGWNLRQVAEMLVKNNIVKNDDEFYGKLGQPAYNYAAFGKSAPVLNFRDDSGAEIFPLLSGKPDGVSYEGYFFPDTYRVYKDARLEDLLKKVFANLEEKITSETRAEIINENRNFFQALIMASILEKEVKFDEDRAMVADILWRRYKKNWALQVDSSVHYAVARTGDVFTTAKERDYDSPWNTYKYPGLPPGPISNPGFSSLRAAINPRANDYWFFLTDKEGRARFARTLEEHNHNKFKYLK